MSAYQFVIKTKSREYLGLQNGPMYVSSMAMAMKFDTIAAANKSRLPSETIVRYKKSE